MSTNLKSLVGKIEIPDTENKKSNYKETKLHLTTFYGGVERGKSLQIGFTNEQGDYCHIQLDRDNCSALRRLLHDNF